MTRKQYTKEFKLDAVRLVTEQGYTRAEAARNLGLNANMLGRWVQELQVDEAEAFRGNGKLTVEQQELRRLREENRRLKLEREVLKNPPLGARRPPCRRTNSGRARLSGYPRAEAVRLLVALTPLKNMAQGPLRICVW